MKSKSVFENEMHFGLYLCTQGYGDIIINEQLCHITCGDAFVRSPLIVVSSIKGSNDFVLETIIEDEIDVLAPIATTNLDLILKLLNKQKYLFPLNKNEQEILLQRKVSIDGYKSEYIANSSHFRGQKAISNIIMLLEQVTILEYIKMYIERCDFTTSDTEKNNTLMIKFIFLLFRNYKYHRNASFYADSLHLSHNHFTRIIKRISCRTPSEWIAIVTINQAKKLLRRNDLSIKEVAEELSFPEQFTFRKYFKHHTGIAPKEFRLSHSQNIKN